MTGICVRHFRVTATTSCGCLNAASVWWLLAALVLLYYYYYYRWIAMHDPLLLAIEIDK